VARFHSHLKGEVDLNVQYSIKIVDYFDLMFLATPQGVSMEHVPSRIEEGMKVVDLSGDYRLKDPGTYLKGYGKEHSDPVNLSKAVYGLPELFRADIAKANLVANPGCYPTASILALAPLFAKNLIEGDVIVDAKSGTSGAGVKPSERTHHPNCGESVIAYNTGKHRHQPEMELILHMLGKGGKILFSPHLVPFIRGILSSCYVRLNKDMETGDLVELYKRFYSGERFVHVVDEVSVRSVVASNHCQLAPCVLGERTVAVFSSIDNLVKGASGQAIQCGNIMTGLSESRGLDFPGLGV
ncbi:MAG TPA: N-acetyl-gamma-glutamyl-phosphate reductase, partial [Candidatus Methanomethylophilaceae archaeon]|nr:N-acetyl-gamma-glutamyl-phosphate reductase [Candidatus Methanomethylophilaceae archaeon]